MISVGRSNAAERVLVEAFVSEPAVQALDEAFWLGFPGRDAVTLNAVVVLPLQDRARGELDAVVGYHQRATPALWRPCPVPAPRNPKGRHVDRERQAIRTQDRRCELDRPNRPTLFLDRGSQIRTPVEPSST